MRSDEDPVNENRDSLILDHVKNPICIFNRNTGEITEKNTPYSALFPDPQTTVDALFRHGRTEYNTFMHQLQQDHAVTDFETFLEYGDTPVFLRISASILTNDEILLNISDITESKMNERTLRIQRDLGFALAPCSSVHEAVQISFDAAAAVAGTDCGGIYLAEPGTRDFVPVYTNNLSDHLVRIISHSLPDATPGGNPVYSGDEEIPSPLDDAARKEGLHATGIIPVCHNGRTMGAFYLASRSLETIPVSARYELEQIISQVGGVLVRIQAEEKNAENKADMQTFFDTIPEFIFVLDAEGRILHANQAAGIRLGYPVEDLLKMNVLDLHPPERRGDTRVYMAEIMAGERDFCPIPLLLEDGSLIPVETTVTHGHWGGHDVLFCISRDITESERAKEILERRDDILNAVSFAAHGFLQNDRWDDQIDDVLRELGHAAGVDRVYIFQNHTARDGTLFCNQRFEWCTPDTKCHIGDPRLQNVDAEAAGFSRWIQLLGNGSVLSGDVDTFPKEERELLRSQGIRSLVVVPVISDSQWWGYIGFDECKRRREWSPTEIDALRVAADILGSAIYQTTMKEMFKQPVEQSLVGTYLLRDGIFEYVNPRFAEMFGYEVDELIHIERMETLTYPEDLLLFKEQVRRRLSGEVRSVHYELRGLSKTNELIYLDAYGSVIEFRGRTAIVGNLMDITERKLYEQGLRESLDEKVVLLNEIHHRVKNNLQIISAFIELQMLYLDDEAGLESLIECNNRILTMALIHESLYKSDNFTLIPVMDYVDHLIRRITLSDIRSRHHSYDQDIEDIILPLDTAMPCSLVITEFINLTLKYMPSEKDEQRIGIRMHREPDSRISLTLSDDTICLPKDADFRSSDLLELELIHRLVTDQLKGTIGIQTEQGLQLNIRFPELQR